MTLAHCILGLCLQSPLARPVQVRCVTVERQDNCTVTQRDKRAHQALIPGMRNPVPFSGGGSWSFSTTAVGARTLTIDGRPVRVKR